MRELKRGRLHDLSTNVLRQGALLQKTPLILILGDNVCGQNSCFDVECMKLCRTNTTRPFYVGRTSIKNGRHTTLAWMVLVYEDRLVTNCEAGPIAEKTFLFLDDKSLFRRLKYLHFSFVA